MTTHRQMLALAAQAIDFDLTARDRDVLSAHLATCTTCRVAAARLRADAVGVESRRRIVPAPGMRARFETIWLPRAGRSEAPQIRLLLVLAAVLLMGISAMTGIGGVPSRLAFPVTTPIPSAGNHLIGRAATIPLAAGPDVKERPCVRVELACASDIMGAFGAIWTTATDAVIRLDSDTGRVLAKIPIQGHPIRIAADARYLWVSVRGPGSVVRIDPATNSIKNVLAFDGLPSGIATGAGAAWLADEAGRSVLRLDPGDGHVVATIPLGAAPWEVAVTTNRVWVTNWYADQLIEIDPAGDRVVGTRFVPNAKPMNSWEYGDGVTTQDDLIFVGSNSSVQRFDAAAATFTRSLAPSLGHVAVFEGRLWLASSFTRVIEERDPETLEVLVTQHLKMSPTGGGDWDAAVTVTGHSVWIRSYWDDAVIRLDRTNRG